jgi:2,4-didehydro-3-deoxy-L-rhamnonate hydrolase
MKLCRFNEDRLGVVIGQEVADVTAAVDRLPLLRWPAPHGDHFIRHFAAVKDLISGLIPAAEKYRLGDVTLLSPVANPSKIVAAPVNYAKHLAEARADAGVNFGSDIKTIDYYGLFLKSSTRI